MAPRSPSQIAQMPGAILDSTFTYVFDTASCAHTYVFNADGTLATDTMTDGSLTVRKSYTYNGGLLQTESAWVLV